MSGMLSNSINTTNKEKSLTIKDDDNPKLGHQNATHEYDAAHTTSTPSSSSDKSKKKEGEDCSIPVDSTATEDETTSNTNTQSRQRISKLLLQCYAQNTFLIRTTIAILLAYAYPPLGETYLAPNVTATWIAVILIFLVSGITLQTNEFASAVRRWKFNLFVQSFNFGIVSILAYAASQLLLLLFHPDTLSPSLVDGAVICSCLPTTITSVTVLTRKSGGDEAAAVLNTALSLVIGVFVSPALILAYLGVRGGVNLGEVCYKLGLRVILPLALGKLLTAQSRRANEMAMQFEKRLNAIQSYALLFIVYTVSCRTFGEGNASSSSSSSLEADGDDAVVEQYSLNEVGIVLAFQLLLLCVIMVLAWYTLLCCFREDPKLRVMGLFGCTHKTVAVGIPLLNAIYDDDPLLGHYALPLLVWYAIQILVGSALVSRLSMFVTREEERLKRLGSGGGGGTDDGGDGHASDCPSDMDGSYSRSGVVLVPKESLVADAMVVDMERNNVPSKNG